MFPLVFDWVRAKMSFVWRLNGSSLICKIFQSLKHLSVGTGCKACAPDYLEETVLATYIREDSIEIYASQQQ